MKETHQASFLIPDAHRSHYIYPFVGQKGLKVSGGTPLQSLRNAEGTNLFLCSGLLCLVYLGALEFYPYLVLEIELPVAPQDEFYHAEYMNNQLRYTQYRGLAQVRNWVKLKFAAMNLKKLAEWKWRASFSHFFFIIFMPKYTENPVCA